MEYNFLDSTNNMIKEIDKEILILLKRRFRTIEKKCVYIKKQNINYDFDKDKDIFLKEIFKNAKDMNLNLLLIQDIYELLFEEDNKIIKNIISKE